MQLGAGPWAPCAAAAALLTTLIAINTAQNGRATRTAPQLTERLICAADVSRVCASKSDAVALWRSGVAPDPRDLCERELVGTLLWRGVLCPASHIVTHVLFGGGRRWTGKALDAGGAGANTFADGRRRRRFSYAIAPSQLDGKPALVLTYRGHDRLFGGMLGMRDELRALPGHPGLLLGLGGMAATGGVHNSAPFVLETRDVPRRKS
jgi:hypothetical protein